MAAFFRTIIILISQKGTLYIYLFSETIFIYNVIGQTMYCLNDGRAGFMLIYVAGNQDDVIKRTKFENMFVNTSCSGYILIQKVIRICASLNTFCI